jgi:hypothetical protein
MKQVYIYGLIDPTTSQLRYIGKSINPNSRFRKHLQDSKKKITYKDKWIFSLIERKIKPELIIIDTLEEVNWEFWEIHYISYFKSIGCSLTNLTCGGENPPNLKGRKRTIEEIEKIRLGNIGKKRSKETRENISKSKKGKPLFHLNNEKERSLSHKKNLSLSLKGRLSPNKGKIFSKEYKNKLSKASTVKKRVIQFSLDDKIIKIWNSITEAQKELNLKHISECCRNKNNNKTSGGYKWKYYEE